MQKIEEAIAPGSTPSASPPTLGELEALLTDWRAMAPQQVALADLRIDPALQPRAIASVALSQANAEERRSEDHIAVMAIRFRNPAAEVEPVLVVQTPEGLHILDGHHRAEACRLAGRETIPARIRSSDMPTAVALSKLVNFGGEKMGMHPDQRADAAWQLMARMTDRGLRGVPQGVTQRAVAERFAISVGTVNKMVRRLRQRTISPDEFRPDHCDPGTGWPRWLHARRKSYCAEPPRFDPEEHRRRAAALLARTVAEAVEQEGPGILRDALAILRDHGFDDAALHDWREFVDEADPEESDY